MPRYNFEYLRNRLSEPSQLISANDQYHITSDQKNMLGRIFDLNDGRRYRYAEAGGSTIAKAVMTQCEAVIPNWVDEPQTTGYAVAAAIGDTSITLLLQTALEAHDMDDGWLLVNNETGEGELYRIKSHTIGTTPVVQIADEGGIRTATKVTSTETDITLIKNKWKDIIVVPAGAQTHVATGVPNVAITGDYFGWVQTRGPCAILADTNGGSGPMVPGDLCGLPANAQDHGTVGLMAASMATAVPYGKVMWLAEDLEYAMVDLTLE
jgi:hypothetical protein